MTVVLVGLFLSVLNFVSSDTALKFTTTWATAHQGSFCVPADKDLDGWKIHVVFSDPVQRLDLTKAAVLSALSNGKEFIIGSQAGNAIVHAGDDICTGFMARTVRGEDNISGYAYLEGSGAGHSGQTNPPGVSATQTPLTVASAANTVHTGGGTDWYDYSKVLGLSILFYDAQRSGKLPANNPIPWRGDSSLTDKGDNGEDLTGGWYDAGDLIKFNLPMASATTILSWGFLQWSDGYKSAGQLDNMFDMIKWPLDYFLKCWNPTKKEYYVQVGESSLDSTFWGRPEDMPPNQKAFKITTARPGSDVSGITAAALTAGSMIFKTKDAAYGTKLLDAAKSLYEFAKTYTGLYSNSVAAAAGGYPSNSYKDELCVAAAWLYKATKEDKYLADAKSFHLRNTAWALSWDDSTVECQLMLYELTNDATYRTEVGNFLTAWRPGGTIPYSPCGLAFRSKWGSLRYAASSAFVALMAADRGIDPLGNREWALSQINYMLGDNKQHMSFVVGFGSKYPLQPHHRASSCPDKPASCDWAQFHSTAPNPQILKGALVGGPDGTDTYTDKRSDYVGNEVAVDYNAGFQSAIAGLVHLDATGNLPPAPSAKC